MYRPPVPSEARLVAAGKGMRKIRTAKPGVTWLQGHPADLWSWAEPSGAIKEQELTFFGRTIVRRNDDLMTGLCHEGGSASYLGKTGLLDFDSKIDGDTLVAAYLLLRAIPERARSEAVAELERAVAKALADLGRALPAASA
jgi:hypothetical protein